MALKGNSHEIKRILNGLPHFDGETKSFVETTVRFLSDSSNRDYIYSMFSPQEREEFLAAYEQSNRQIVSEYFDGRLETLFSADKEEKQKWTSDNPYMYEDIIKYFGEVSLMHQKNVIELQGQISKLEKAVLEVQKENISLKKRIERMLDTFHHPQKVFQYLRGRKKER